MFKLNNLKKTLSFGNTNTIHQFWEIASRNNEKNATAYDFSEKFVTQSRRKSKIFTLGIQCDIFHENEKRGRGL